jgi:hypothetical protein
LSFPTRGSLCFGTATPPDALGPACLLAHPLIRFNQDTVQKTP